MKRSVTPSSAPSTPSGTTRITAAGIDQLSYSAASTRNTASSDSAYSAGACEPEDFSCSDWPVHSKPMPAGSLEARCSISSMASPVLAPVAASPEMRTDG